MLLTTLVAPPSATAEIVENNASTAVGYYKMPGYDAIFRVSNANTPSATVKHLTYAEWVGFGSPAPATVKPAYLKYP